jgi:hypothetical protein
MQHWKTFPLWFRSGIIAALIVIIIEAIYITAVIMKLTFVLSVFTLHATLLFPIMLIMSVFKSPLFLVQNPVLSTGGIFLLIAFWFIVGAVIGLITEAFRPHYAPPKR